MEQTNTMARRGQRGFSLTEIMVVVLIIMIIMGMAMISLSSLVPAMRANSGMNSVMAILRSARETAIASRRNIRVEFVGTNQIRLTRFDVPVGTTVLGTWNFEAGIITIVFAGVPDTPDLFGNATAVSFGGTPTMMFMSDGTFVDANGLPLNGTVFLGLPGRPATARAISIVGATGRIRAYRWTGAAWAE